MTTLGWFIVISACVMSGVCVLAFGLAGVQRRAMRRYWGQGT